MRSAWMSGLTAILIFSGSLPATKVAVTGFDPVFLSLARAAIAGILALILLAVFREARPERRDLASLAIVAAGVVLGFPFLTAVALQHMSSAHSIVFVGLLPLATALFASLRGGERPRFGFWIFSCLGSALVMGFALSEGTATLSVYDLVMLAAVALCALGYAEGAVLSRRLGGWQVIAWSLVLSLPVMLPLALVTMPVALGAVGAPAWWGLAYVSLFSMLIGFVFWYPALAKGGTSAIGQLQLLQPFFGLALAALLLREEVSLVMVATALGVVGCVAGAKAFTRPPDALRASPSRPPADMTGSLR
jgi:drug/metabolite transporter (DMT)-like permease